MKKRAAEKSDSAGSESSDTDRDTDINLVSSPALPADPARSRSLALLGRRSETARPTSQARSASGMKRPRGPGTGAAKQLPGPAPQVPQAHVLD